MPRKAFRFDHQSRLEGSADFGEDHLLVCIYYATITQHLVVPVDAPRNHHRLSASAPISKMLIERLSLSSLIEADSTGISLIAAACDALVKSAVTVEELWPGDSEMYDLSS